MIFPPPPRNFRAELLDVDEAPFDEVKDSLRDVQRVNKYLSGYKVLLLYLSRFLANKPKDKPITVLDVATGSADQPIAMVRYARRKGFKLHVTALDINSKMIAFAKEEAKDFPEIRFVQGDIHAMPFKGKSFDLVVNSLSLHHFTREHAVEILKTFSSLARWGFIVNDLHRSRIAYAAIFILTRLLTQNRLTRYDAPVSVMNAFTPSEMVELVGEAGLTHVNVYRHFPYRLALVEDKQEE